jgi:hypothetical protein
MTYEEKELLKLFEKQDIIEIFAKASSYLNNQNALFKERDQWFQEKDKLELLVESLYLKTTLNQEQEELLNKVLFGKED